MKKLELPNGIVLEEVEEGLLVQQGDEAYVARDWCLTAPVIELVETAMAAGLHWMIRTDHPRRNARWPNRRGVVYLAFSPSEHQQWALAIDTIRPASGDFGHGVFNGKYHEQFLTLELPFTFERRNKGAGHLVVAREHVLPTLIFYYTYGLLHSEDYRARYADNLTKELPRIPCVKKIEVFRAFAQAGRDLAELHVGYETVEPYPVTFKQGHPGTWVIDDPQAFYRVTKMKFAGKRPNLDKSTVIYNANITMQDIALTVSKSPSRPLNKASPHMSMKVFADSRNRSARFLSGMLADGWEICWQWERRATISCFARVTA